MPRRYDTANMTAAEREDLLIRMVPGDVVSVAPGLDAGCPCSRCTSEWGEGKYANGGRQRGGWCPELRQLTVTRAGFVSRFCPSVPEGGEVYDPGTVRWGPITIIKAGSAPVKGAAEASRELLNFPTTARREGPTSHANPRRAGAHGLEGWC